MVVVVPGSLVDWSDYRDGDGRYFTDTLFDK